MRSSSRTSRVLNAADHGIPQARPRLFVVGTRREDRLPKLSQPTHTGSWEGRKSDRIADALPHVTTGDALAGLVAPRVGCVMLIAGGGQHGAHMTGPTS